MGKTNHSGLNDVKKVYRRFPLDICLICLKFFLQQDVIMRIGFFFILVK